VAQELKEKGLLLAARGERDKGLEMTGGGGKKPGSYQWRPCDQGARGETK
jgi:hypothetical protein